MWFLVLWSKFNQFADGNKSYFSKLVIIPTLKIFWNNVLEGLFRVTLQTCKVGVAAALVIILHLPHTSEVDEIPMEHGGNTERFMWFRGGVIPTPRVFLRSCFCLLSRHFCFSTL